MTYTIRIDPIEEHAVPGKHLGRHVRHDSRSLVYAQYTYGSSNKWVEIFTAAAAALGVLAVPNSPKPPAELPPLPPPPAGPAA